ncbi:hypothetical protein NSQ61_05355 [Aeribacillus sp. FSL K6-1121]|uniref:hypothetical protein n=1 Tax=Aeribacillus TaxID=1055323 RepID=UPI000E36BBE4|nr:hypothetical protein [Aeribacillus composti]MED0716420.1 hypothetical protein [Aeribacillus composti]MED0746937.1 hypothetical protein [Aeribacillus composti]REJ21533.1 MAG: hypothetical protein C6W54_17840 [Bacillaceae bacterium]
MSSVMSLIPLNWKCRSKRWKRSSLRHDAPVGKTLAHKRHILVEDRAYFKIERIDHLLKTDKIL